MNIKFSEIEQIEKSDIELMEERIREISGKKRRARKYFDGRRRSVTEMESVFGELYDDKI